MTDLFSAVVSAQLNKSVTFPLDLTKPDLESLEGGGQSDRASSQWRALCEREPESPLQSSELVLDVHISQFIVGHKACVKDNQR